MNRSELAGRAARSLESGRWRSPISLALSAGWSRSARVARPIALPVGAHVVGIGGSTLGGSYKTPLTLALAQALAARGERVAVVAHGYGGTIGRARAVEPTDDVTVVGDDALWLARDLRDWGVPVFVGRRRWESVALAAAHAPMVLVDGLLQAVPERLALSILAVNGLMPWGSGLCPPAGDLRGSPEKLLRAADVVVEIFPANSGAPRAPGAPMLGAALPTFSATTELVEYPTPEGGVSLSSLSALRVGLVLAVARPERVTASLAADGITPAVTRLFPDHARPTESPLAVTALPVDVWVTTPKCATKMGSTYEGAPVVVLRHAIVVPEALVERATKPAD